MLERVAPPCFDPILLGASHRFETPVRTTRLLGRAFWHRRGDDLDAPNWWLDYLKTTRHNSRLSQGKIDSNLAHYGGLPIVASEAVVVQQPSRNLIPYAKRTYVTNPIGPKQAVHRAVDWDEDSGNIWKNNSPGYIEANHAANGGQDSHDAQDSDTPSGYDPKIPEIFRGNELEKILNAEDYARTQDAWTLFLSNRVSPFRTRRLVQFLCSSTRRSDRQRGLSLFMSLPHNQRSRPTYTAAVKASARAHDHSRAIMINQEALTRAAGLESSQFLLAYFVKHQYWKSAAKVWLQVRQCTSNIDRKFGNQRPLSPNPPDRDLRVFWKDVDKIVELPGHLLSLCRKLQERKAVLRQDEGPLKALAAALLRRVVSSPQIMAAITGEGFLSLIVIFVDVKRPVRGACFAAIRTLWRLRKVRNRSELAMIIYRNQRVREPDDIVHRGILGSLISMCSDAQNPAAVYDLLLKDFETFHGAPDEAAYQRAMTGCARQGDAVAVNRFFRRLWKHHGKPTVSDLYAPLLYVYAKFGNVAATQSRFDLLKPVFGVTPATACWNILLSAYAQADDVQGCFTKFMEMRDARVAFDKISLNTLIGACSRRGDINALRELGALAYRYRIRGSNVMVGDLVECYCMNGELDKAERLAEHATRTNGDGAVTRMWNLLLRHHAFRADTGSMIRIQNRMHDMGIKLNSKTYAVMMAASVELGRTDDAAKLLWSLPVDHKLSATVSDYFLVLEGFVKEEKWDMAATIYKEVLERFPDLNRKVRRSMYRLQAGRDSRPTRQNAMRMASANRLKVVHALDVFANTIPSPYPAERSSQAPPLGLGQQKARELVMSRADESVIGLCLTQGRYSDAELLLSKYETIIEDYDPARTEPQRYLELLRLSLVVNSGLSRWSKVDNVWEQSLTMATSGGLSMADHIRKAWPVDTTSWGPWHAPDDGTQAAFVELNTFPEQPTPRVLFLHRYMLEASFSAYAYALSQQNRTSEIEMRMDEMRERGFALTGANWNEYVQLLANSADAEDQLLAFSHFETQLLPDSRAVSPRRSIPTHATLTALLACLEKLRAAQEGSMSPLNDDLRQPSPAVLEWLQRSTIYGFDQSLPAGKSTHKELSPRVVDAVDRAGMKGSQSPLDEVPVDSLVELHSSSKSGSKNSPASPALIRQVYTNRQNSPISKYSGWLRELEDQSRDLPS